ARVMVQFSAAAFTVGEGDGQATITVTRSSDVLPEGLGGVVMVSVSAVGGGSATPNADFTPTTTTLTFNPGERNQTFRIPILEDDLAEGDETVVVTLSNPTNSATLGTPSMAILTIQDNDQPRVQFSV